MTTKVGYRLSPEVERKLEIDIATRLDTEGKPILPGNDYERHLFARRLRLAGKTKNETESALVCLGLEDIPPNKKESYVKDILNSVLVGFDNTEPIYGEGIL